MKLFSSRALQNSKRDGTVAEEPKQQQQPSILNANTVSATGNDDFVSLGCSKWIQTVCETVGIKTPTPIQRLAIGPFIKGQDVIGSAETGSGKTAAFALPILHSLACDPFGIYALVLTPTRELALQILEQFKVFGKPINVQVALVTGGMSEVKQSLELSKRPHVVIATPGRLADMLRESQDLHKLFDYLRFLVLDEVDRLLDPMTDYGNDLKFILQCVTKSKDLQIGLFSATIKTILDEHNKPQKNLPVTLKNPAICIVGNTDFNTVEKCVQEYAFVPFEMKLAALYTLVKENADKQVIIFCASKNRSFLVSETLKKLEIPSVAMNGLMKQEQRISALADFRNQKVNVLVATDLASRGLDLPVVDLVINYDLPRQTETYVHRIGRTARAGKSGVAITIVTPENVKRLSWIEKALKTKLVQHETKEVPKRRKQLRPEWSAEEKAKYEQEYLLDVVMKNMSKVDTVFQIVKLNAETEELQKERDLDKEQKEEAKQNAKAQKRKKFHLAAKQKAKREKK